MNKASVLAVIPAKEINGLHKGRRAWVMGNGPSLNKITADQWGQIDKDVTIGVNDIAATHDVQYLLVGDPKALRIFPSIITSRAEIKFVREAYRHLAQFDAVVFGVQSLGQPGLRFEDGFPMIQSVTPVALNLAIIMGCNPIIFLGVDYRNWEHAAPRPTDKPNEPYGRLEPDQYSALQGFKMYAEHATRLCVTVLNGNPDSALECFPKVALDELLRPAEEIPKRRPE